MTIVISLFDKTGKVEVKLVKGKNYTITKGSFSVWEKIEVLKYRLYFINMGQ